MCEDCELNTSMRLHSNPITFSLPTKIKCCSVRHSTYLFPLGKCSIFLAKKLHSAIYKYRISCLWYYSKNEEVKNRKHQKVNTFLNSMWRFRKKWVRRKSSAAKQNCWPNMRVVDFTMIYPGNKKTAIEKQFLYLHFLILLLNIGWAWVDR